MSQHHQITFYTGTLFLLGSMLRLTERDNNCLQTFLNVQLVSHGYDPFGSSPAQRIGDIQVEVLLNLNEAAA